MKNFARLLGVLLSMVSLSSAFAFTSKLEILSPQEVPDYIFMDSEGSPITLKDCIKNNSDENKGKVIVLNFWSITCGPCVAEMPALDQLAGYYSEKDLMVIPINIDPIRLPGLENFYTQNRYRYLKIYQDPKRTSQELFQWNALPTTFIINREGRMVGRLVGQAKWDSPEALAMFDKMLKGQNPEITQPNLWDKIKGVFNSQK